MFIKHLSAKVDNRKNVLKNNVEKVEMVIKTENKLHAQVKQLESNYDRGEVNELQSFVREYDHKVSDLK
jgi:hypothetical protein